MVKMKIRNRKLLASLNQKKRFKDFEYKNYDSTDSDIYEDEDYLKIDRNSVETEPDYLRKRRLERRFKIKLEIQKRVEAENLKLSQRGGRRAIAHSQPATKKKERVSLAPVKEDRNEIKIKTSK